MRGIVWYKNKDVGFERMQSIMHGYELMGIKLIESYPRNYKDQISVAYENGDYWKCIPVRLNQRGNRANVSIVERCIDKELFYSIIFPQTLPYPYKAFDFYGEGELGWRQ